MTKAELDLAMALRLMSSRLAVPLVQGVKLENNKVFVRKNDQWRPFSATSNWADFGLVLANTELVLSTHAAEDVDGVVSKFWYSAHAFFGGTSFESLLDVRIAAGRAVAALLRKN